MNNYEVIRRKISGMTIITKKSQTNNFSSFSNWLESMSTFDIFEMGYLQSIYILKFSFSDKHNKKGRFSKNMKKYIAIKKSIDDSSKTILKPSKSLVIVLNSFKNMISFSAQEF